MPAHRNTVELHITWRMIAIVQVALRGISGRHTPTRLIGLIMASDAMEPFAELVVPEQVEKALLLLHRAGQIQLENHILPVSASGRHYTPSSY